MAENGRQQTGNRAGWLVVAAVTTVLTATSGARLLPGLVLKPVTTQFGWSRSELLLAVTLNMVVLSIFQPFVGWLSDRFGARLVFIFGVTTIGLVLVPLSFANQLWQFYILYGVVAAVGLAAVSPVNVTGLVAGWFQEQRGTALSIATSGSAFGQLMVVPAATWLLTITSWPSLYRSLSILLLAVMLPVCIFFIRSAPASRSAEGASARPADSGPSMDLSAALRTSAFWLLAYGFFTCGFTMAFANTHFMAYADDMGMSMTVAADIIATTAVFSIIGSFLLGMAADRFPRTLVLSATYALRGLAFVMLWVLHVGPLLFVYAIVLGISWTATTPLTAAIAADLFGRARLGLIFGTMFSFMNLGFGAGSFLDGLVYDSAGSYRLALLVNAGMGAVAAVAVARVGLGEGRTSWRLAAQVGGDRSQFPTGSPSNRANPAD